MAKKIYTVLKLKDEFTKPLKNATKEEKAFAKQAKLATAQVNAFATRAKEKFNSLKASARGLATALTGIGTAITVAGAVSFGKEAIEAAKAQIEAETKLEAILGNIPSIANGGAAAIKAAKDQLTGVASELQKVGIIGDEITIAGQQQLASYQLSTDSISELSKGMTDLLAQQYGLNATQENAVSIANMIGKAMSGQTSALSRAGIIMTDEQARMIKVGDETQRAAVLAEVLKDNVGGVNEALAQTDQGKIQQATNNIGDMKEEIGKKLLPVVANVMSYVNDHLPQIQSAIETVGSVAKRVFSAIGKAIGFVKNNMNWILPVITALVSGFLAFKTVTVVVGIIKGISTAITTLKLALTATTLAFSPIKIIITIVAAAIGFLVAKFRDLYNNNENFRNSIQKVAKVLQKFGEAVKKVFGAVVDAIKTAWSWLKEKLAPVLDWLKKWWDGYVQKVAEQHKKFMEIFGPIWEKAKPVFEKIKNAALAVYNAVAPVVQGFVKTVVKIVGKIVKVIVKVVGKIVKAIAKVVGKIVEVVSKVIGKIVSVVSKIVEKIVAVVKKAIDAIKKVIEKIVGVVQGVMEKLRPVIDKINEIVAPIKDAFDKLTEPVRKTFNKIKGYIQGAIDKLKEWMSWLVDEGAYFDSGRFHMTYDGDAGGSYATGTSYAPEGLHKVNEFGGEIMNLPGGTQVIPHDISEKMARNSGSGTTINVNIQGNVIGDESYANYLGSIIAKKIVKAEGVM